MYIVPFFSVPCLAMLYHASPNPLFSRKQVQATKVDAAKDSVTVPTTLQEYCVTSRPLPPHSSGNLTDLDFYDDEDYVDEDDDDYVDEEAPCNNEEDSGNSDS